MAYSKIRGTSQIKDLTISGAQIASGTVSTDKLTDGAKILLSDGTVSLADDLNLGNNQIKNVGAPVDDNDAVRKTDLDAVSSGTSVFRELPSGAINGTNTSFSLNNEPNIGTEQVFLNGSLLNVGANSDYVIADDTITFTVAPIAGDVILVNYITNAVLLSVEISSVVSAINSRLTTAEGELFTAQGDITSLDSDLAGIDSRLTTAEADIVTVEGDIASIESSITSVQSDIASVESDIAAEESARISAVDALDSSVSSIQTSVTSLGNRMTAAEGDIGDLEAADATMDTRVGAIEDGLQSETTSRTNADNSLSSRVTTLEGAPATSLSALTDVSVSSLTADQILKYNGTVWVNGAAPSTFSGSYTDLTNKPTIPTDLDSLTDVVIATPLKGHIVVHNGTNFVNSNIIETSGAAVKALVVKGSINQTANLLEIQNSDGVAVAQFANDGSAKFASNVGIGTSTTSAMFHVKNTDLSSRVMIVQAAGGQTANLLEMRNSAGTGLSYIDKNGNFGLPSGGVSTPSLFFVSSTNMGLYRKAANVMGFVANGQPAMTVDGASGVGRLGVGDIATVVSRLQLVDNGFTTTSGLTLGLTSGTLVQLYRSADNTLSLNGAFNILNAGAANKALIVKGAASQTANLLELQNSTGTALWSIDSTGSLASGTVPVARVSGLATVATSGSYVDLTNKPTIPSVDGLASETYVDTAVAGVVNSAPGVLNTLNELALALGSDANFSATIAGQIGAKADTSSLATVATSGSYTDLTNKPTIPSVDGLASETYVDTAVADSVNSAASSLATVATSGSYTDLTNKPTIPSVDGLASETYVDTAVSTKADTSSLASVATSGSYTDLTNKPTIALAGHQWSVNHTIADGTRYLIGDIVYDNGNIYVANYENESMPTSSALYWTNLGAGKRINIDGRDIENIQYSQLSGKPSLFDGAYASLTGKPSLFDGAYASLTGKPTIYTPVKEVPSGNINGTNVTFVISDSPAVAGTEQVFLNGLLQFAGAGDDYTISGDTITFNTAPETGWKLVVCYSV